MHFGAPDGQQRDRERHRARNVLVIAQVAMAMVLLVCAGLMIRTFQALRTVEPGFTHAEHLQTLQVSYRPRSWQSRSASLAYSKRSRTSSQRYEVTSVGFATSMPMEGTDPNWNNVFVEGQTYAAGEIRRSGCSSTYRPHSFARLARGWSRAAN
jgi:hypothetical protein